MQGYRDGSEDSLGSRCIDSIFIRSRPVSLALRPKVVRELERLVQVVKPNGSVRIQSDCE